MIQHVIRRYIKVHCYVCCCCNKTVVYFISIVHSLHDCKFLKGRVQYSNKNCDQYQLGSILVFVVWASIWVNHSTIIQDVAHKHNKNLCRALEKQLHSYL